MRTVGAASLVAFALVVAGTAGTAEASWYFRWECFDGACAGSGALSRSGIEGPYSDDDECWHARRRFGWELNTGGGAGHTGDCYSSDVAGGTDGGSSFTPARAAQLARLYVGAIYAPPWQFTYADGTTAESGPITGGEVEVAVGRERFGLEVSFNTLRAAGPPARADHPEDVMWTIAFGIGLHSSPFALLRRGGLEVRPDVGVAIADVHRLGCESCDFDIARKSEPSSALGFRARGGLDIYLGRRRASGVALEVLYERARMNPDESLTEPTAQYDARIESPTWWLRLSFVRRGRAFAAY
jgi:hypothetical protein